MFTRKQLWLLNKQTIFKRLTQILCWLAFWCKQRYSATNGSEFIMCKNCREFLCNTLYFNGLWYTDTALHFLSEHNVVLWSRTFDLQTGPRVARDIGNLRDLLLLTSKLVQELHVTSVHDCDCHSTVTVIHILSFEAVTRKWAMLTLIKGNWKKHMSENSKPFFQANCSRWQRRYSQQMHHTLSTLSLCYTVIPSLLHLSEKWLHWICKPCNFSSAQIQHKSEQWMYIYPYTSPHTSYMREDVHATRQLRCQWWSGHLFR